MRFACLQVIRRELSDNFCHYCPHYDSLEACYDWARDTLRAHANDKREYLYTRWAHRFMQPFWMDALDSHKEQQ